MVAAVLATAFAIGILGGPYRAVERSDYMTYQTAGRIVLQGQGTCLYSLACQERAQRELIGDETTFERGVLPFTSPPWLAALTAPLAALPLWIGFALFTLLSTLLLAVRGLATGVGWGGHPGGRGGAAAERLADHHGRHPRPVDAGRRRARRALRERLPRRQRDVVGGVGRPGSDEAHPRPALAGAARSSSGAGAACSAAALVIAGLVLGAALIVSPRAVADYPAYLLGIAGSTESPGIHVSEMINWRGATLRLGGGGSITLVGVTLTLAAVGLAWWWARHSPRAPALGAAIAFVATPLVIPHANQHELVLASLGLLLAVTALSELRVPLVAALVGFHAVLWAGPLLSGEGAAWLIFIGLLVWLVVLLALSRREGSRYFRSVLVRAGTD